MAIKGGAKIITGGKRHAPAAASSSRRCLRTSSPTRWSRTRRPLVRWRRCSAFKDEAEVIAMCNNSPFGLASYFYSRDLGRVWRVAEALESGMVGVNTGLITTEVAPSRRQGEWLGSRRLTSRHEE